MNPFAEIRADVVAAIAAAQADGSLPAELPIDRITIEPPRDPSHGDAATNAALILAKPAGRTPMELAELLATRLAALPKVTAVQAARPGFVNLTLQDSFWRRQIGVALRAGVDYGAADLGRGAPVNVEYCSANPTGPLHVGHGRGTVFGDALANLLARMGWAVTREYYINDAGSQIDQLARSLWLRYREALGDEIGPIPEGMYPGDYLIPPGRAAAASEGPRWRDADEAEWLPVFRARAVDAMMALIRDDLAAMGVRHDVFTSEKALVEDGRVDEAVGLLEAEGLAYVGTLPPPKGKADEDWEPVPLLLFRATRFGDDVDRPLRNSRGEWTYFAKDLAYHLDKYRRGFAEMIDVWGADHGGHIKRMQAAVAALSGDRGRLDLKICQLVNLLDGGEPLRMSKRAGRIVTLRDVVDEVGRDVVRFIMLTRRNDAPLDFDLAKVTEQSRDNPVWYVQYAHARIASVLRHAAAAGLAVDRASLEAAPVELLADPAELALVRQVATWPRVLEAAAVHHEPHRLTFYLLDLAASFHALWNQGKEHAGLRFLQADQAAVSGARLAMIAAVQAVLAGGLQLIGVEPLEEML
ncbi:MAG TPA: arginine--tRNA ligase [Geminicoccaceae bacterium]|nr:arginine--tRNA ligase [Geminicoccaceae bacterium]